MGSEMCIRDSNGIARMVKSYFEDMGNEEFSAFKIKNCEILKFEF